MKIRNCERNSQKTIIILRTTGRLTNVSENVVGAVGDGNTARSGRKCKQERVRDM